jgi:hypothetical protein
VKELKRLAKAHGLRRGSLAAWGMFVAVEAALFRFRGRAASLLMDQKWSEQTQGESKSLVFGAVSAEAGTEADANGRIDRLKLLVGLLCGMDSEFSLGFAFVDESLAEKHDHQICGMNFDAFGFGVTEEGQRS